MSTVSIAQFIAESFVPCLLLAIAGAFAWRFLRPGKLQTAIQIIASLLFFMPPLLALFLANYSIDLLFYQRLTLAFMGYGMMGLLVRKIWGKRRFTKGAPQESLMESTVLETSTGSHPTAPQAAPDQKQGRFRSAPALLAAAGISGIGSWFFVGDYLLPHKIVEGITGESSYHQGTRTPGSYEIFIDGKSYGITRDLLSSLHHGEHVHAEVGVGSNTILVIHPF